MKLFYLVLLTLVFACTDTPIKDKSSSEGNVCEYSKWLRISETKKDVLIEIQNPDDASKIFRIRLPNANREIENSSFEVEQPIKRMACLSSTHIGMLSELNLQNRVVAVSDMKYIFDPKIKELNPIELGEEQLISIERVLKSEAEVIVYSAFSSSFNKEKVLRKVGVTCIPNFDWRETHPLGRAEWILLFGYLTGHQKAAKIKFAEIKNNYMKIQAEIDEMKSVSTLSGNMTGDYWYAPGGDSYHAQLLEDAGLNYVFTSSSGTGSLAYSFEKILGMSAGIDLWLNPGFKSKAEIIRAYPKSILLPFLEQSSLFCYTHTSNKFWELSACRPDLVLADYSELGKGEKADLNKLVFYKRVE
jgi:iron complex transport system substrate-binding protein